MTKQPRSRRVRMSEIFRSLNCERLQMQPQRQNVIQNIAVTDRPIKNNLKSCHQQQQRRQRRAVSIRTWNSELSPKNAKFTATTTKASKMYYIHSDRSRTYKQLI